MSKNSFLKGAFILGVAGIIVKIMGAFFRIPLGNIITSEGMGYYQTAYPIYVFLLAISSSGFPTAISKLVSERLALGDKKGAHKVFRVSFIVLILTGIISSTILFLGSNYIVTKLIKNEKAYYAMVAIAPALLFVPIMAAFRGYFQGKQEMMPTAISQIIEQFGRVVIGIYLAILFLGKGKEYAAAGASFGATAGAMLGSIFMAFMYLKNKSKIKNELKLESNFKEESSFKILNRLLSIAIPITIGSSIMPIMNMIDVSIVMRRLQEAGFTYEQANSLYGQLTGMAATLINLPQVLTVALAVSLVPVISHSLTINDLNSAKRDIKIATKAALIIGLPAAFGLASLSGPIMKLLYPNEPASAGQILFYLSMGVIFISLIQTFTGILQGMGKAHIPVINLVIGSILKIALTYTLTAIPSLNVKGAAIGTVVAYMVASVLNLYYIKKHLNIKFGFVEFVIKPFIAVILMSISAILSYKVFILNFKNSISTLLAIAIASGVYFVTLLSVGAISEKELAYLPKGQKVIKILKKLKIFR
ncbi:stage V sporulation protein B [Alkalithermobacter thermoalcaliphilus JW-YL-7 = DSM 7308]|uniref:Polysaccharide biosynthesis protein n=1 Tax=Alkalithermobacter thermoalcaliphilus JW-YL-7 = DSM 7308 TaxID=1121328 RepID=A0A150FSL6_CLOPD|nr:polysaccharide biosynthesis protein [[Clostridium] paradoxum JW-YL-7 = DSM 7308]SHK69354.1 stage V sporulation protein B [[Clostridium] paradoxum JW-YL-7 = DSM 7308]